MLTLARQFASFAGVGAIGTAAHYVTLIVLVQATVVSPVVGSMAGFTVGALINYFLNYRITFRSRNPHGEAIVKFFIIAIAGLALNSIIMAVALERLAVHYLICQLIATGVVLVWNFLANRLWTFREKLPASKP